MIVLLDCDGVLADFVGGVLKELDPRPASLFIESDVTEYNIPKALGIAEERFYGIIDKQGFCSSLEPYPGAQQFVEGLREGGHSVYVVTSPVWSSGTWGYERLQWLRHHFGFPSRDVIQASAKHLVRGDALVEDNVATLERWSKEWPGIPVLLDRPWNRNLPAGAPTWRVPDYDGAKLRMEGWWGWG